MLWRTVHQLLSLNFASSFPLRKYDKEMLRVKTCLFFKKPAFYYYLQFIRRNEFLSKESSTLVQSLVFFFVVKLHIILCFRVLGFRELAHVCFFVQSRETVSQKLNLNKISKLKIQEDIAHLRMNQYIHIQIQIIKLLPLPKNCKQIDTPCCKPLYR